MINNIQLNIIDEIKKKIEIKDLKNNNFISKAIICKQIDYPKALNNRPLINFSTEKKLAQNNIIPLKKNKFKMNNMSKISILY